MADNTQQTTTANAQPTKPAESKGPDAKRPSLLHFMGNVSYARPRRAAQGDNGARLLCEVYIPFPVLGLAIKTGIWGQPKSEQGGAVTAWVPEFSLPRKVQALDSQAAEIAIDAFKDAILDGFAKWAEDVQSGKAQNVDAPTSRAVRSVRYTL